MSGCFGFEGLLTIDPLKLAVCLLSGFAPTMVFRLW